jgi:hypothetical protein
MRSSIATLVAGLQQPTPWDSIRAQFVRDVKSFVGVSPRERVPELDSITEKRWREKTKHGPYSWCGDFPTFMAERWGCKDPTALNRVSVAGAWTPGDNIARLIRWAKAHEAWITGKDLTARVQEGDFYIKPRPDGSHIGIVGATSLPSYETIDGNGWMGAVSQGKRTWTDPVTGFVDVSVLLGIHARPHAVPTDIPNAPQAWPKDVKILQPVLAALGLPTELVNPYIETKQFGE